MEKLIFYFFLLSMNLNSALFAKEVIKRSKVERANFQRENPCPSTNKSRGKCEGYVVDHIIALACGGLDRPNNMQWQTIQDAKEKDKWERKDCIKK